MLSCRVISHNPTVTAEFAFENKWNAENVVANYHNQRVWTGQNKDRLDLHANFIPRLTDVCSP